MHADLVSAILDETPLVFAAFMHHSNVLSKESYNVMVKLGKRTPMEQTSVLLHFLRQDMSNPIKYKHFIESVGLLPAQQILYSRLYTVGKFAWINKCYSYKI